jgi:hypothetical protein
MHVGIVISVKRANENLLRCICAQTMTKMKLHKIGESFWYDVSHERLVRPAIGRWLSMLMVGDETWQTKLWGHATFAYYLEPRSRPRVGDSFKAMLLTSLDF